MEQSCGSADVTDEDIMVAAILLELPGLISQSHSLHRFPFTWGSKGKRSTSQSKLPALKQSPPHQSFPTLKQSPPLQSSPTLGPLEKALTSSPATPLSFPLSESDEKPRPPPKRKPHVNNLRKKKEQLLAIMEDLSGRNELLKQDIQSKKLFLDHQKSENIELKAKKLKISMETGNGYNRQNWMMEQTTPKQGEYPIGGMMIGYIDLNVSAEDAVGTLNFGSSMPFDLETATKARAAARARLIRKQICSSSPLFVLNDRILVLVVLCNQVIHITLRLSELHLIHSFIGAKRPCDGTLQ
ncbi:hypothetical protein V6N13_129662 [Hibiscus sabdariffa]